MSGELVDGAQVDAFVMGGVDENGVVRSGGRKSDEAPGVRSGAPRTLTANGDGLNGALAVNAIGGIRSTEDEGAR